MNGAPHTIAIGVCTYNRGARITGTLDSLARQKNTTGRFTRVIIVNNIVGEPANFTVMGATGTTQVNIPVILVSNATGAAIKAQLGGGVNATMAAATQADTIASFSSRGPRLGKPNALKPDVAAPGINITSSQTGVTCTSGNCQRPDASGYVAGSQTLTLSGTSMAAPVSSTSMPRTKPSVVSMATQRTVFSPKCCATSSTSVLSPFFVSSADRIAGR